MGDIMSNENIVELNDKTWEKTVEKKDKPVMVMFYSQMCPYCKSMDPYFEEYAEEFKDKVVFAKVNVTENPFVVGRYGVMGIPTFKFFCNGQPVQELVGAVYPHVLKKTVEDALQYGSECVKKTTRIDTGITGYT